MRIAYRFGHNFKAKGATGYVDETLENRNYGKYVIKYLTIAGHECIDCTPGDNLDADNELMYGITKVNSLYNIDFFLSMHLNAFKTQDKAVGSEVLIYPGDKNATLIAQRITLALQNIGFINRGVKENSTLGELRLIKYTSIIIEPFFVDSKLDVDLYKKIGAEAIGKSIAEAINGGSISNLNREENNNIDSLVIYNGDGDLAVATLLANKLNCPLMIRTSYNVNQIKANKFYVVGGTWTPEVNNSILLSGNDRVATMQMVLDYIRKI